MSKYRDTDTRKPNNNGEFLLDATPDNSENPIWTIYDLTSFLPTYECYDRNRRMSNVSYTIKGKKFTVHIIDQYQSLDEPMARKLAGAWYDRRTAYHRLD